MNVNNHNYKNIIIAFIGILVSLPITAGDFSEKGGFPSIGLRVSDFQDLEKTRPSQVYNTYYEKNMFDGDLHTCWAKYDDLTISENNYYEDHVSERNNKTNVSKKRNNRSPRAAQSNKKNPVTANNKHKKIHQKEHERMLAHKQKPLDKDVIKKIGSSDLHEKFVDNEGNELSLWKGDLPTADLILLLWDNYDGFDDLFRKHRYTIEQRDENIEFVPDDDFIPFYKSWQNDVCQIGILEGGTIGPSLVILIDDKTEREKLYKELETKIIKRRRRSPEFYEEQGPELCMIDGEIEVHIHQEKPWINFNAVSLVGFDWNYFEDGCITCGFGSDEVSQILDWYGFKETVKGKKHHIDGDIIWEDAFECKDDNLLKGLTIIFYSSETEGSQININFPDQKVRDYFLDNCLLAGMNTDNKNLYWYLCCAESGIYMEVKDLKARIYTDGLDPILPL